MSDVYVIKHYGRKPTERFSADKLRKSIVLSCENAKLPEKSVQIVAEMTMRDILTWLKSKHEITTQDIRQITTKALAKYNREASYIYAQFNVTL